MSTAASMSRFKRTANQTTVRPPVASSSVASIRSDRDVSSNPEEGEINDDIEETDIFTQSARAFSGEKTNLGPEVHSSVASAVKVFWVDPMTPDAFKADGKIKKHLFNHGKIPSNCPHLETKKCNPEIFQFLPNDMRTQDHEMQRVHSELACMTSYVMQAASTLHVPTKESQEEDIKSAKDLLSRALNMSGLLSRDINRSRRNALKPHIDNKIYGKYVSMDVDEASAFLYGENLHKKLEDADAREKTSNLLKKKGFYPAKPISQKANPKQVPSENTYSSQKAQGRRQGNNQPGQASYKSSNQRGKKQYNKPRQQSPPRHNQQETRHKKDYSQHRPHHQEDYYYD